MGKYQPQRPDSWTALRKWNIAANREETEGQAELDFSKRDRVVAAPSLFPLPSTECVLQYNMESPDCIQRGAKKIAPSASRNACVDETISPSCPPACCLRVLLTLWRGGTSVALLGTLALASANSLS